MVQTQIQLIMLILKLTATQKTHFVLLDINSKKMGSEFSLCSIKELTKQSFFKPAIANKLALKIHC